MSAFARTAFIGGGSMAGALIGGLLKAGADPGQLHAVEIDAARREQLAREYAISTAPNAGAAVDSAELIVLALKPQQMKEACVSLALHMKSQLVLSIAAGIRARDIARWLGTDTIVRAMPNTPALIGLGISGLAALPAVSAAQREAAATVLRAVGKIVWFDDESQLDAVTAISGSGPAYVFCFIEALIAAGRELGLSDAQARELAIGTFTGSAQLAAQSGEPPQVLRERVTSKGGTTAAALAVLQTAQVRQSVIDAVLAAHLRAGQLGDEFGK